MLYVGVVSVTSSATRQSFLCSAPFLLRDCCNWTTVCSTDREVSVEFSHPQSHPQAVNQSIDQSINPSIIHQSIKQSSKQAIDQSINQSIHRSISQSINNQSIDQPIKKSCHFFCCPTVGMRSGSTNIMLAIAEQTPIFRRSKARTKLEAKRQAIVGCKIGACAAQGFLGCPADESGARTFEALQSGDFRHEFTGPVLLQLSAYSALHGAVCQQTTVELKSSLQGASALANY